MPAFFNDRGSEVLLNCGLRAERGTVRTSATRVTPCARSSSMNSSIGRVEWPTVRAGIPSPTGSCGDSDFLGLVQAREVVQRGAAVGGVVVLEEEPLDEFAPGAARGEGFPFGDLVAPVQADEAVELCVEGARVFDEVLVFLEEQGDAGFEVGFEQDAGRGAHARDQRFRDLDLADLAALAFDVDSTSGTERGERGEELALEPFLRGLRAVGEVAEHGTAMGSELFEVQYLFARALQGLEVAALAAPRRTVDHDEAEGRRQNFQLGDDPFSVGPVTTLQGLRVPADLAQDVGHRAGALAAAPAVDERAPVAVLAAEQGLDVTANVLREERGAELARVERRHLLVEGADRGALGVVERWRRDRAGNVVFGVFGGRAGVEDRVKLRG